MGFLAKMNELGTSKVQVILDHQALLPAFNNYKELYPASRLTDLMVGMLREYTDSSWLMFWPVELDKQIFSVATEDLDDQHIRLMREFRDHFKSGKTTSSAIKELLMQKLELNQMNPNRVYLVEILVYHKLYLIGELLQDPVQLAECCDDLLFLLKAIIFYFDFELDNDLANQKRCNQVYFSVIIYSLQVLTDSSDALANDKLFEVTKELMNWIKLCIYLAYEQNPAIFDEPARPKQPEGKFFSSKGGSPFLSDDTQPLCITLLRQVLVIKSNNESENAFESLRPIEPPAPKRSNKPISFGSKKPNLLDIDSIGEVKMPQSLIAQESLIDRHELTTGSITRLSTDDKLKRFISNNVALTSNQLKQQYLSKQKPNLYQLRMDLNGVLTRKRSSEKMEIFISQENPFKKLTVIWMYNRDTLSQ